MYYALSLCNIFTVNSVICHQELHQSLSSKRSHLRIVGPVLRRYTTRSRLPPEYGTHFLPLYELDYPQLSTGVLITTHTLIGRPPLDKGIRSCRHRVLSLLLWLLPLVALAYSLAVSLVSYVSDFRLSRLSLSSSVAAVMPPAFQRPFQCESIGSLSSVAPTAILIKYVSTVLLCACAGRCSLLLLVFFSLLYRLNLAGHARSLFTTGAQQLARTHNLISSITWPSSRSSLSSTSFRLCLLLPPSSHFIVSGVFATTMSSDEFYSCSEGEDYPPPPPPDDGRTSRIRRASSTSSRATARLSGRPTHTSCPRSRDRPSNGRVPVQRRAGRAFAPPDGKPVPAGTPADRRGHQ